MTTTPAISKRRKSATGNRRASSGTREKILAASLKLVAKKGYAGTSISMICKEAGLNASSLYWFFDNKEDLFLSAIRDSAEEFLTAVQLPLAGESNDAAIARLVGQRLSTNANFLRLLLIMMLEEQDLPVDFRAQVAEIRAGSLRWWGELLRQQFQPLGETTASILAADFAPFCRATLNGAFIAQQYGEPIDIETIMRQLLLLLSALLDKIATEKP